MLVERKQLLARVSVPHLAGAVVAARDELAAALVEGAVGERKQVGSQDFEEPEALHLVLLLLLDELFNEFLELRLAGLRDQRLFQENLVNKSVNIRPVREHQTHVLGLMLIILNCMMKSKKLEKDDRNSFNPICALFAH